MKCIIPCAGRGTRMGLDKPKVLLRVNGVPILGHIIKQWAEKLGINYSTFIKRLHRGWSVEKAISTSARQRRKAI